MAGANLYGQIYGIKGTRDLTSIRGILENVRVPAFTPKSSVKIHVTDKEMEEEKTRECDDAGQLVQFFFIVTNSLSSSTSYLYIFFSFSATEKVRLEELNGKLASPSLKSSAQMYPIDFEKVGQ